VVALGPGAGSTRQQPALLALAEALAASGRRAVLFNFPYSEAGRRRPDPPAILEAAVRVVAEHARGALGARRLVLGGRSMGGRIASQAVAAGLPADALVFLAYPLHPPGRPEQLRDRHLPQVEAPMLFVQGTRDDFARADLLEAVLARLGARATLHRVLDGDHSFGVLKRSGRTAAEVREEIHGVVLRWLDERGL
jgi:predicted alpha/beta-hydrolase family hydrolase